MLYSLTFSSPYPIPSAIFLFLYFSFHVPVPSISPAGSKNKGNWFLQDTTLERLVRQLIITNAATLREIAYCNEIWHWKFLSNARFFISPFTLQRVNYYDCSLKSYTFCAFMLYVFNFNFCIYILIHSPFYVNNLVYFLHANWHQKSLSDASSALPLYTLYIIMAVTWNQISLSALLIFCIQFHLLYLYLNTFP